MARDRNKLKIADGINGDRTKVEIAACIAEILAGLVRMARDQKLNQLQALLDSAIRQAEYDATNERKASSRKRRVA